MPPCARLQVKTPVSALGTDAYASIERRSIIVYLLAGCVVMEWLPGTETMSRRALGAKLTVAENVHFRSLKPIYIIPGY